MNAISREQRCGACLVRFRQDDDDQCSTCALTFERAREMSLTIAATYGEAWGALKRARDAVDANAHMRPLYLMRALECRHHVARLRAARAAMLRAVRGEQGPDLRRAIVTSRAAAAGVGS